jgi:hypothetical protein
VPWGRARHRRRSAAALRGVASLSRQHERRLGVPARVRVRTAVRSTSRVDASDGLIGRLRVSDGPDPGSIPFSGDHRIGIDTAPARLLCCECNRLQELLVGVRWTELGRSRSGALALSARLTALSPRSSGLRQRNPNPRPLSLHAFSRRSGHGRRDLLWWVPQHPWPCLKEPGPPRFGTRAGSNPPWLPTSIRNSVQLVGPRSHSDDRGSSV